MKLLILAAGYATRLYPLTENQAKPLLPVAGKPMIDHVIEKFSGCAEIDGIYVVTNQKFTPHFEKWAEGAKGKFDGRPIRVFNDRTTTNENRLGAIGDILFVMDQAGLDDDLIVVAGDNLFSGGLQDYVAQARQKGVLIGVHDVKDIEQVKKYNSLGLEPDGKINFFEEKSPNPQSTVTAIALYHYPKNVLPMIRQYAAEGNNTDQPGRLVQWLYPRVPCHTYEVKGIWLDIGSLETYEEAQKLF
ncbi:nucleotidyltransferase family protein [Oscillatoria amoena NRMC-F 0135]|nr:nucleotidyltransferase family protein [Oscillatoria amoena NRMC-F 0135]